MDSSHQIVGVAWFGVTSGVLLSEKGSNCSFSCSERDESISLGAQSPVFALEKCMLITEIWSVLI